MSPLTHVSRALGWNLGNVVPSAGELVALEAAGVRDPAVQRYAAWRRSLLLVAIVPTTLAFLLAVWDTADGGFGEYAPLGVGLELAWLVASLGLAVACAIGVAFWTKPGSTSALLVIAWATTFLLPFAYALLPATALYHVHEIDAAAIAKLKSPPTQKADPAKVVKAKDEEDEDEPDPPLSPEALEKAEAVEALAVEFVLSGTSYLLLLPAVLSLIPGVVNGCLRIKSLLPAAQLPGWFLVCAAPAFLLFWMVLLCLANHAARSPILVGGVLLWAGAPLWYAIRGRVFVRSQIGKTEAARVGGVKRLVGITTLLGLVLMLTFALTTKVVGLNLVGLDRAKAVSTKIEILSEDDEISLEDVQTALAESKSFVFAFDLSSWRFVVDFLAKFLVVLAVFADLVLRATLASWANDRAFRAGSGASAYDAAAAAAVAAFEPVTVGRKASTS